MTEPTWLLDPVVDDGVRQLSGVLIEVAMGPSATIAHVEYQGHTAIGEAKRMPADPHSDEVAVSLAVGRALETLSESLTRYGMARSHVLSHS